MWNNRWHYAVAVCKEKKKLVAVQWESRILQLLLLKKIISKKYGYSSGIVNFNQIQYPLFVFILFFWPFYPFLINMLAIYVKKHKVDMQNSLRLKRTTLKVLLVCMKCMECWPCTMNLKLHVLDYNFYLHCYFKYIS